jgi:hypothetical protein
LAADPELADHAALVPDRHSCRRLSLLRPARGPESELVALHEVDRGPVKAIGEDVDDLSKRVIGLTAPIEDRLDHISHESPSNSRTRSLNESGMPRAFRSSRSTSTSVWCAVASSVSSSTRYAAHS